MFCLDHKTTRHSLPDMTKTFKKLIAYMTKEQMNETVRGRKTKHSIPDTMVKGMEVGLKTASKSEDNTVNAGGAGNNKGEDFWDQIEDLEIEEDWNLELL